MRTMTCAFIALLAAGCGQAEQAPPAPHVLAPAPQTLALELEPLRGPDIEGRLSGELGCSFSGGDAVLAVAQAHVDPAARSEMLIKRNGAVAQLAAVEPGGYDAMVEGAAFAGEGLSVEILTRGRMETGNEQVAYNATITIRSGDAEQMYPGDWTCGP